MNSGPIFIVFHVNIRSKLLLCYYFPILHILKINEENLVDNR